MQVLHGRIERATPCDHGLPPSIKIFFLSNSHPTN